MEEVVTVRPKSQVGSRPVSALTTVQGASGYVCEGTLACSSRQQAYFPVSSCGILFVCYAMAYQCDLRWALGMTFLSSTAPVVEAKVSLTAASSS